MRLTRATPKRDDGENDYEDVGDNTLTNHNSIGENDRNIKDNLLSIRDCYYYSRKFLSVCLELLIELLKYSHWAGTIRRIIA